MGRNPPGVRNATGRSSSPLTLMEANVVPSSTPAVAAFFMKKACTQHGHRQCGDPLAEERDGHQCGRVYAKRASAARH